jgi:prepilin-type N-terminal cleavage/methylation domain-containing protein
MSRTPTLLRRTGFTIPELLVAMAVALGIMVILTESFRMGMDLSRFSRGTGEMMSQLQGAGVILNRDLQLPHFLAESSKPNEGLRLSDQRLDTLPNAYGPALQYLPWTPPKAGFFRIVSPQPNGYHEQLGPAPVQSADREGFYINTATNHALHFTAIHPGGVDQFSALVNNFTYTSRAAEIAYFLVPMGERTSNRASGRPLYHLIRRQRLVAVTDQDRTPLAPAAFDTDVIASDGVTPYTLADLTNPSNRLGGPLPNYQLLQITNSNNNPHFGEDILLSNVISFEVRVDWTPNLSLPVNISGSNLGPQAFKQAGVLNNTDYPWDYLSIPGHAIALPGLNIPAGSGIFDTWFGNSNWSYASNPVPLAIRVKSLQIIIRLYDSRIKSVRQNTWTIAM